MKIHKIEARDLPDLWFQAVYDILTHGNKFTIDKGSYEGQIRLEYDYFIGHVKYPGTQPLLPDIPESLNIPNPVEYEYVYGGKGYGRSYIEYLMTDCRQPNEDYTYGERLAYVTVFDRKDLGGSISGPVSYFKDKAVDGKVIFFGNYGEYIMNQIEWVIDTYKIYGHRNNQMILQIAKPSDLTLDDPPCLRHIDTRIQDNKLHFFVYFRSWDLWAGLPANLAAIQTLKEYMASEIGVEDGEMIVESKGLHLYGYAEDLAKLRCNMKG